LLVAAAFSLCAQDSLPRFEDFPVTKRFKGVPAKPILATPEDKMYRTRIRQGISNGWGVIRDGKEQPGPNFAGHYFVIEWGCGVPCVMTVVADAETGKIYHLPLAAGTMGTQKIGTPFFGLRSAEVNFRLTSRLLTIDACPEQYVKADALCYSHYYLWENNSWKLLRRVQIESPLFDAQ
jgi:hypothetical protein